MNDVDLDLARELRFISSVVRRARWAEVWRLTSIFCAWGALLGMMA
jgi:hypothetical protein